MDQQVITRFAPSPTGKAHIGSYRTAMYAWLFARKHGGKFILRIEDTDVARNDKESEQDIYQALAWLGIDYDEKYIQSHHVSRHQEIVQQLINNGSAYISKEEAKDGSGVIKDIVRFRNPQSVVTFHDLIRGEISTDVSDLGDFVIARSLTEPLYHLAVVVDDHDEGVTHVIRAEEHIANTPRQILLHQALGWTLPAYAHLPIVLGPDKQKLSKRRGAIPVTDYAKRGYLEDAVFNAVAMVGWNPADPGSEQEIFDRNDLIHRFDLARVQKSSAVFNEEKLNWFNREYIKKLSPEEQKLSVIRCLGEHSPLVKKEGMYPNFDLLLPIIIERINTFGDVSDMIDQGEFSYYTERPIVNLEKLSWKGEGNDKSKKHLLAIVPLLETIHESSWNTEIIKSTIWPYAESKGKGSVLWPLRFTLSGRDASPDPFTLAAILGKQETLARVIELCDQL